MSDPTPMEDDMSDQDYRRMNIQEALTMMGCPYYRGEGKCESGCYSEPSCITDSPEYGWEGVLIEAEREEPGSVLAALITEERDSLTTTRIAERDTDATAESL